MVDLSQETETLIAAKAARTGRTPDDRPGCLDAVRQRIALAQFRQARAPVAA
jgi:hypothetical protein